MISRIKRYMTAPCEIWAGAGEGMVTRGAIISGAMAGLLLALAVIVGNVADHAAGWVFFILTLAVAAACPLLGEISKMEEEYDNACNKI